MTFNHGDRVTCKINGVQIDDARISITKKNSAFLCYDNPVCINTWNTNQLGYKYSLSLMSNFTHSWITDLKLAERTLEQIVAGDWLNGNYGNKYEVTEVLSQSCAIRHKNSIFMIWYTFKHLKSMGYTLIQPTPEPKEMTIEEISEALGYQVKIKK